jgi:hypothetical protein
VLKLDTEGDGAANCAKFLELSACEEQRQFFIWKGGVARPWTTDHLAIPAVAYDKRLSALPRGYVDAAKSEKK